MSASDPVPAASFEALRTAIGTTVGHGFAPLSESVELAAAAERGGLDFVSVGDSGSETLSLVGALTQRTGEMQLMSGIAQWTRTPVTLAHAAKTLQNLAQGRYWLGIGPMPRPWAVDHHGMPYEPVAARMREYVTATRAAIAATEQSPTDHDGEHYRTVGFPGRPMTPERPIPLLLAATRPKMTQMAAELCDGVMLNSIQPLQWLEEEGRAAIAAGLERAERPRERFSVGAIRFVGIDEDRDRAYDHARRAVAYYFAIPYFRALLEPYGFTRELDAGEAALKKGDVDAQVAAVSDELVDAVAIAGTPQQVVEKLRRYDGLLDWVIATGILGQSREAAREQTLRVIDTFGPHTRRSRAAAEASAAAGAAGNGRPVRFDSARPIRRAYLDTPGGQVHVREHGEGTPVLLLHQTASSSVMWERVMRAFAPGYRLIAMDTPGFGGSDPVPAGVVPTMGWYADRAREVLDALGVYRAHVVGHHTGAMVAAELAAAHPERVDRLALIGCVVVEDEEERRFLMARTNRWQLDARGDFMAETLIPRLQLAVTTDDPEHMQQELTAYLQAGPRYALAYDAVWSYDATARLPLIAAPTLCAVGEEEPENLLGWTEAAARLIPGARFEHLPGGTELAFQQPLPFAARLGSFLSDNENEGAR